MVRKSWRPCPCVRCVLFCFVVHDSTYVCICNVHLCRMQTAMFPGRMRTYTLRRHNWTGTSLKGQRWDKNTVIKFVQLMKKYECLWSRHSKYIRNDDVRLECMETIHKELNDRNITMNMIRSKVSSLKSSYQIHLRKVHEDSSYAPPEWFNEMYAYVGENNVSVMFIAIAYRKLLIFGFGLFCAIISYVFVLCK